MKYNNDSLSGTPQASAGICPEGKLEVRGKFLFLNERKLYLKGLSLGGQEGFLPEISELATNVVFLENPGKQKLDFLHDMGLGVIADLNLKLCLEGLFEEDARALQKWFEHAEKLVGELSCHPTLLCYELGAGVTNAILKDLGKAKVAKTIRRAFNWIKKLDPDRAVTCTVDAAYADLELGFLDFYSYKFSVPTLTDLRIQLSRLQAKAADRPLVAHLPGASSDLMGEDEHAFLTDQQIRMAFMAGCAGAVLPRSGLCDTANSAIALGLMAADGRKKRSFAAARDAFRECPFPSYLPYPRMSVVICVYNGEDYIEECLDGCSRLDYPNFEVIIVNDGSTDCTLALAEAKAREYGFTVLSQMPNGGLSAARNLGMRSASGEIVAYLDSDAFPDEHWLRYLAITFLSYKYAIVGGPNINPLSTGAIIDCIDKAPGNSQIVMLDDEIADHVPGCNLAVRRAFMETIGGFDDSYTGGGDDVTFCWRVIKAGATLGVSPGAMVWHYRRPDIKSYFKQQRGYGKGEAVLEKDYPERFNSLGHQVASRKSLEFSADAASTLQARRNADTACSQEIQAVQGSVSSPGLNTGDVSLNAGCAGVDSGGFDGGGLIHLLQSPIYQTLRGNESIVQLWLGIFPSMPEWTMLMGLFAVLSLCSILWSPFCVFIPAFVFGVCIWLIGPICAGLRANLRFPSFRTRIIVFFLHLAQPIVRMQGRLSAGMSPWRSRCKSGFVYPKTTVVSIALPDAESIEDKRKALRKSIRSLKLPALEGSVRESWDWQVEGGIFGGVRVVSRADASGLRLKIRPYAGTITWMLLSIMLLAVFLGVCAQAWPLLVVLLAAIAGLLQRSILQSGEALSALRPVLSSPNYARRSVWARFDPPRHFFDEALPGQRAGEFASEFSMVRAAGNEVGFTCLGRYPELSCACTAQSRLCTVPVHIQLSGSRERI